MIKGGKRWKVRMRAVIRRRLARVRLREVMIH